MIDPAVAAAVREIVENQRIAALGTLHGDEPYVSMVPFACLARGEVEFVIHVSALAAHTKDMLERPAVSLLVMANPRANVPPQALARLTIQANARPLAASGARHADAKRAYLERFPDSEMMFGLGDFSLFALRPRTLRYVGGFAQAKTITAETLDQVLGG